MRVLIGFAEAVPAPEVALNLHDHGFDVTAFARTDSGCPLGALSFIKIVEVEPPERCVGQALYSLQQACQAANADLVMPLCDPSLWLLDQLAQNGGIPQGVRLLMPGPLGVRMALDKRLQIEAALAVGLRVPPTLFIEPGGSAADRNRFPCIAKPAEAVAIKGGRMGKGEDAFFSESGQLANWCKQQCSGPYLVQPHIRGTGEGIFGVMRDGRVLAWSGHRRLRLNNPAGGASSAVEARQPDAATTRQVEEFLRACSWEGMFMVEFLRDQEGTLWFMELNGRAWGSMALACRQGFNYPAWSAKMAVDPGFEPTGPKVIGERRVRHLGWEVLHLLFAFRGPPTPALSPGWPRRGTALRQVLSFDGLSSFYNYHPRYPWFFLREAVWRVRSKLRGRLRFRRLVQHLARATVLRPWFALSIAVCFVEPTATAEDLAPRATTDANIVTAVDVSDSIGRYEEWLQQAGLARGLVHEAFINAATAGHHGKIGFSVISWSSGGTFDVLVPWMIIASAEDAARVAARLSSITLVDRSHYGGGDWESAVQADTARATAEHLTDVSEAVDFASNLLNSAPYATNRAVINICANGVDNVAGGAELARNRAVDQGITINGVVLGRKTTVVDFFRSSVIGGPGSFVVELFDAAQAGEVMAEKFKRELRIAQETTGALQ